MKRVLLSCPLFSFFPRSSPYVRVKSSHFPPCGSEKPRWHVRVATRWHLLESSPAEVHMPSNSQEAEFDASIPQQSTSWYLRDSTPSQLAPCPCLKGYSGIKSRELVRKPALGVILWEERPWDPGSCSIQADLYCMEQASTVPQGPFCASKGHVNCFEDNLPVWGHLKSKLHPAEAGLIIWETFMLFG